MLLTQNIHLERDQESPFYLGHKFHLVTPSPWPAGLSMYLYPLCVSFICWMNGISMSTFWLFFNLFGASYVVYFWFRDIVRESTYQGYHTLTVQRGISIGFGHFILSEVMLFATFFATFCFLGFEPNFRAHLHLYTLYPDQIDLNGHFFGSTRTFPTETPIVLDAYGLPTYGTFCLLLSAVAVTLAHRHIRRGEYQEVVLRLVTGLILGLTFVFVQFFEYKTLPFSIFTDAYSSCFYLTTGFHGMHVIIGLFFLLIACLRTRRGHFNTSHHLNLEFASYYWHFVDVIWIFLYLFVYHSNTTPIFS
jgi:heme/copper-type cytochrome/quinol oxidase subunit 3